MLVDVEVIVLVEIVPYIKIRVTVEIDIGSHHAKAVSDHGAVDAGFLCHVGEVAVAIVAKKPITGYRTVSG